MTATATSLLVHPVPVVERGHARVGCSGWRHREWRGPMYSGELASAQWLERYSRLFDTVEVDCRTDLGRAAAAPPGFVFALQYPMLQHDELVERLGAAAGPSLVQLPWGWSRSAARLDEFLAAVPANVRRAVEFGDPSWFHDDVYDVLCRHGAAMCIHDGLADHPFVMTTNWTYVRFRGPAVRTGRHRGAYGAGQLTSWALRLCTELERGNDVFCYFDNDHGGLALADAQWLRHVIDGPHLAATCLG